VACSDAVVRTALSGGSQATMDRAGGGGGGIKPEASWRVSASGQTRRRFTEINRLMPAIAKSPP